MKHYIYLTEDKLYYIRKENRARGYSFMGSRTITGPETVTGAMESLADIYNLKGRAVVLAIEAGFADGGKTAAGPGRGRRTPSCS